MVLTANQPQQEEDQVYDVVIVVEKTANLVPYLDELKTSYLLPTLEYFNGGPPSSIDTGHDYNCTLYCLVTYTSGDSAPEMTSDCTYPTTSTHELIQSFDNLQFIGGAGQSCSHVSEGLSTALQCLDEIKQLRYSGKPTQRHCILICNSPPYHITAEESQDYRGYNSEQLASMMGQRGVNLSIISPRKIPALQKLFNEASASDGFHNHPQAHYAVDPRHLVLLKGFHLQERSLSPKVEEDKKQGLNAPSPALLTDTGISKTEGFKKPLPNQSGVQQTSPQQVLQPVANQMAQSSAMGVQQVPNPQTSMADSGNLPNQGIQGVNKQNVMVHTRPQVRTAGAKTGPQSKAQNQPGMTAPGSVLQQRMRQQQPQQDPNFMMRQPSMAGSGQGMMGMQQPSNVGMSSAGPMMNQQHIPQQAGMASSQANMMASQAPTSMMGPMQTTAGPPNPGMMQPGGVMGGLQQQQHPQAQQPPPPSSQTPQQQQQQQYSQQQNMQPGFMPGIQNQGQMDNMNQGQLPMVPGPRDRRIIWSGTMEYQERNVPTSNQRNVTFLLNCNVSVDSPDTDIVTTDWPQKLTIQLLPQAMLSGLQQLCKNSRQVFFHFPNNSNNQNPEAFRNLYTLMGRGFAGCVHFPAQSETRIILLMYSVKKKSFIGLIPNDQMGIVQGIKNVVARYRLKQQQGAATSMAGATAGVGGMQNPGIAGGVTQTAGMAAGGMMQTQMPMQVSTSQQQGQQQTGQPQTQQQQQQPGQTGQPGDQRRQANLQMIQNLQNDLQAAKQRELQFQQQQPPQGVDQKKVIMVQQQQQQQQAQQQQMLEEHMYYPGHHYLYQHAHRAKLQQQQQQQQQLQAQRLQMHQQQQQQQQQVANPQLRHLLINQQQQQIRQQQLMMQQQMRGSNPQGQPGGVMGPGGQQGMQGGGMGQMAPQPGQNFIEDFNLPEIL